MIDDVRDPVSEVANGKFRGHRRFLQRHPRPPGSGCRIVGRAGGSGARATRSRPPQCIPPDRRPANPVPRTYGRWPPVDGVHPFEHTWAWSTLAREHERLEPFLTEGRRVADEHDTFASAVSAFAAQGFSITAAARELHVHPNTVAYRLDRWRDLTGWNPRTFDGLLRSMAVLRLPSPATTPTSGS